MNQLTSPIDHFFFILGFLKKPDWQTIKLWKFKIGKRLALDTAKLT